MTIEVEVLHLHVVMPQPAARPALLGTANIKITLEKTRSIILNDLRIMKNKIDDQQVLSPARFDKSNNKLPMFILNQALRDEVSGEIWSKFYARLNQLEEQVKAVQQRTLAGGAMSGEAQGQTPTPSVQSGASHQSSVQDNAASSGTNRGSSPNGRALKAGWQQLVKQWRNAGLTDQQIVENLRGKGWSDDAIQQHFRLQIQPSGANGKAEGTVPPSAAQSQTSNLPPKPKNYVPPLSYAEFLEKIKNEPEPIVPGFVSTNNIDIFFGDSGIGKTPFATQLGLCIAAGVPFLGIPVRQAVVIYADFENGGRPYDKMVQNMIKFLGLPQVPELFKPWQTASHDSLEYMIAEKRMQFPGLPIVVILDTVREFDSRMEGKNDTAADSIADLRRKAKRLGATLVLIHHLRKPNTDPEKEKSLNTMRLMDWANEASGAKALITQSNYRVGFDSYALGDAECIVKTYSKLIGENGPFLLAKVRDEESGEPIGWKRLSGLALVEQSKGRDQLMKLPNDFTFKQVEREAGNPRRANDWIQAWIAVDVVRKIGATKSKKGHYEKMERIRDKTKPNLPDETIKSIIGQWQECKGYDKDFLFGRLHAAHGFTEEESEYLLKVSAEKGWMQTQKTGINAGRWYRVGEKCRTGASSDKSSP